MSDEDNQLTAEDIKRHLSDREWRLNNLYYIIDKKGNRVVFKLNPVQAYLHENLHNLNVVPKARQLGLTTFFSILFLDQILFSKNKTAGIICHRIEDVKKIFKNKIKFAWENLHPWLRSYIGEPTMETATEMRFGNGGTIFTSMTTRSQTLQYLLVSEFGYICKHAPDKAEEIVTGALNSIEQNQLAIIESTAQGREGYFYNFVMQGDKNEKSNSELTPIDWKLFFFPWYLEPEYKLANVVVIPEEMQKYFEKLLTRFGIALTNEQKGWYVKKQETLKEKIYEEFPSTLDECFMARIDGAYYAAEMDKVFTQNRIMRLPFDPNYRVDTYWDLGMDDMFVILLVQSVGPQIRFVDVYYNRGESLAHYVKWLEERGKQMGYRYGTHFLPHDVAVKELGTGTSRQEVLWKLGMRNIRIGKKIGINEGIDKVRMLFSRFYFDDEKTKKLTDALFEYRKDFDPKLGRFKDSPRHDQSSHFADPVRLLACEWREYLPEIEGVSQDQSVSFF